MEEFVESVAKNYVSIREGANVGGNQTYLLEVTDANNNTLYIQLSRDGKYWNVNSAGIFNVKYSRRKPIVYSRPAFGNGKSTDTIEVNSGHSKGATPEDKPAEAATEERPAGTLTETPKAEQPVEAPATPEGKPAEVADVPEAAERMRVYDLAKGL